MKKYFIIIIIIAGLIYAGVQYSNNNSPGSSSLNSEISTSDQAIILSVMVTKLISVANTNGIHKEELCIGHTMTLMDIMKMDG